jgi:hypothetical protein
LQKISSISITDSDISTEPEMRPEGAQWTISSTSMIREVYFGRILGTGMVVVEVKRMPADQ